MLYNLFYIGSIEYGPNFVMFKEDFMADIFELLKMISNREEGSNEPLQYIIVGLGNPEQKYANTRHNAGFMVLDKLCKDKNIRIDRSKFNSLYCITTLDGVKVLLMKPLTYMNKSGEALRAAADFYKIALEKIIVISDDTSFDVGKIRIRQKGSAGGHNGLKSIIEHFGSDNFPRIKMGVGQKPHSGYDLGDWVLADIPKDQREAFSEAADNAISALSYMIKGDIQTAMNKFN